jgi:hypothetical protein
MKTQTTAAVHEAIINVMSELGGISKSRKNTQQGYAFRGVDDVLNSLQPLLIKNKLIILPEVVERTETERTTKTGGTMLHVIVKMKISCISAIDGSTLETIYVGEAMDSGDKATNKAMSTAYKYFAFQTFCIPTEEAKDTELDSPELARGHNTPTHAVISAPAPVAKPNPAAATDSDDAKEWLNLYNKNGSPNEKGEAAKKFIREGGTVTDIAKKYKLSKAVREELYTLETQVKHATATKGLNNDELFTLPTDETYDVY